MSKAIQTKNKNMLRMAAILVIALVMTLVAAALAPIVAYAADNPLYFSVEQTIRPASSDEEFAYRLTPLGDGSPMPFGSLSDGYYFTIAGEGSANIGPISYSRPGVYRYEIFQIIEEEKPGYTYDRRVYIIEVYVDATLDVTLVIINVDGTKTDVIVFENEYNVEPSDPELMVDPSVVKTVTGDLPGEDGVFTFRLVAKDPLQPMPAGSSGGVKTITIKGSGRGEFGTWSYVKAGTYIYTVNEVKSGVKGYTYDTVVYTITDVVSDENGRLVLSRAVTNNTGASVTSMSFINKYSIAGTPGGGGGEGKPGPKTGDDTNTALYYTLLGLSGAAAAGASIYLAAGRKSKQKNS